MFLTKFLLCMFITNFFTSSFIKIKIINTPIVINLPSPKLHEIIILESYHTKEKIAIDFTPIRSKFTTFSLLFGKNVPGEIRIRRIPDNINIENTKEVLSSLIRQNNLKILSIANKNYNEESPIKSLEIRSQILNKFLEKAVLYEEFIKNNYTMNLYKRNCRHFCCYIKILYKALN